MRHGHDPNRFRGHRTCSGYRGAGLGARAAVARPGRSGRDAFRARAVRLSARPCAGTPEPPPAACLAPLLSAAPLPDPRGAELTVPRAQLRELDADVRSGRPTSQAVGVLLERYRLPDDRRVPQCPRPPPRRRSSTGGGAAERIVARHPAHAQGPGRPGRPGPDARGLRRRAVTRPPAAGRRSHSAGASSAEWWGPVDGPGRSPASMALCATVDSSRPCRRAWSRMRSKAPLRETSRCAAR